MAYPNKGNLKPMSAAEASFYVRQMIHREARGPGDAENAMERLEHKYGLGFWTLDHLRKNKAKTCDVSLFARIKAAFVDHCGKHAAKLLHEAQMARVGNEDVDLADIENQIRALAARLEDSKAYQKRSVI